MTDDVRPQDVQDDDLDGGMTVAAWVTVVGIFIAWLIFVGLWTFAMHRAGTGRGLW